MNLSKCSRGTLHWFFMNLLYSVGSFFLRFHIPQSKLFTLWFFTSGALRISCLRFPDFLKWEKKLLLSGVFPEKTQISYTLAYISELYSPTRQVQIIFQHPIFWINFNNLLCKGNHLFTCASISDTVTPEMLFWSVNVSPLGNFPEMKIATFKSIHNSDLNLKKLLRARKNEPKWSRPHKFCSQSVYKKQHFYMIVTSD